MSFTIVIVDDDEVDRYLVKRIVGKLSLSNPVVEFDNGQSFVDVACDDVKRLEQFGPVPPPTLVLLDINMPYLDGIQVLHTLQQQLPWNQPQVHIAMQTSSNSPKDREASQQFPFVLDYIVKPLTKERLQSLVSKLY